MPILRSRQSNASGSPVDSAILGRWPSLWLRGRRIMAGSLNALSRQAVTAGSVIWRRHLPIWMTSGMFVPDGA